MSYLIAVCWVLITVAQLWGQEAAQFLLVIVSILTIFSLVIFIVYFWGSESLTWINGLWDSVSRGIDSLLGI
jgi:hypothetical protein